MNKINKFLSIALTSLIFLVGSSSFRSSSTVFTSSKTVAKRQFNTNKINIPKKYLDFIKSKDKYSRDLIFYENEDIDLDGNREIIIASGYIPSDFTGDSSKDVLVSQLYILRDNKNKIIQVGKNLVNQGYSVCKVKIIRLQNSPKKYIYCGLTNDGVSMKGFEIFELKSNIPREVCYAAGPCGAGLDELKDFNKDGQFDGYTADRWTYEVFDYCVKRTYLWKNNSFLLSNAHVKIPKYPSNIEELITQYLKLRLLEYEKSAEVAKRLSEICTYNKAEKIIISNEVREGLEFEYKGLNFSIKKKGNTANVIVSCNESSKARYIFHLVKINKMWKIDYMK